MWGSRHKDERGSTGRGGFIQDRLIGRFYHQNSLEDEMLEGKLGNGRPYFVFHLFPPPILSTSKLSVIGRFLAPLVTSAQHDRILNTSKIRIIQNFYIVSYFERCVLSLYISY